MQVAACADSNPWPCAGSLDAPPPPTAVTADLVVGRGGASEVLEQRGKVLEQSRESKASGAEDGQIGRLPSHNSISWDAPQRIPSADLNFSFGSSKDDDDGGAVSGHA